jgi:para-nitrobenzyl esterase
MTDKGPVRGAFVDDVRRFLSIPYAAPPLGPLRWRPPAPHEPWTEEFDATRVSDPCLQTFPYLNLRFGIEDCLFVNVITPDPMPAAPLPVMVWIHGGGFVSGAPSPFTDMAAGGALARTSGAVLVSISYRLGQLGFLAHPALSAEDAAHPASGNYGIEDQIAALGWIRDNIAAFGGDPDNVTIFGESAGGWSVCILLASPAASGLFHRAIVQSGICVQRLADLAAAERQGERFAAYLGCEGAADVLACMRARPALGVVEALPSDPDFAFTAGEWGRWFPVVDGLVLPASVEERLASGAFHHVPVLIGSNADEGTMFVRLAHDVPGRPLQAAQYRDRLEYLLGTGPAVDAVAAYYPLAAYADPGAALSAVFGDGFIACPNIDTAALLAPQVPTHHYQFTYPGADFTVPLPVDLGAFHAADVQFVFGTPAGEMFTAAELELSRQIIGYWSRFAASGDPTGGGAPPWPRLDAEGRYLELDLTLSERRDAKRAECDFWRGLGIGHPPLP